MDCNKEEAQRAKLIAENKMRNGDFLGARKIALKAQNLFPELDNISQLLTVCEVHCSSQNKIYGSETDWYGILQVERIADEATIKKQYRKLALSLHPDKNKFAGAESAFKLIGEANRVLTDQAKRSLYDMKLRLPVRNSAPKPPPHQVNRNSNFVRTPYGVQNNFSNVSNSQFTGLNNPHKQTQSGPSDGRQTFWTACPYCSMKFQYYRDILNRYLRCQSCEKPFTAYDLGAESMQRGPNLTQPPFPFQKEVPNQGTFKAASQSNPSSGVGFQGNFSTTAASTEPMKNRSRKSESRNKFRKRGRKVVEESSESFDTESEETDEDAVNEEESSIKLDEQNLKFNGNDHPRRSSRQRQHVSYKENLSDNDDDDFVSPPKRTRGGEKEKDVVAPGGLNRKSDAQECKVNGQEATGSDKSGVKVRVDDSSPLNSSPDTRSDPEAYEYPDSEFNDFEKDKSEDCFSTDQVWALYDSIDGMPRFYARIKKVFLPEFKLRITWLEPDPDDLADIDWCYQGLPMSCGKFKHGDSEETTERSMFSHRIVYEKGSTRYSYLIYPRKGETWALFKNWDARWSSDPQKQKEFEFEYVEVVKDFEEDFGVLISYLDKVTGFMSLFEKSINPSILVPPNELLRFSHRIPSYRMTGQEREGVPAGSFELDPASLPSDFREGIHEKTKVEVKPMAATKSMDSKENIEPDSTISNLYKKSQLNTSPDNSSRSPNSHGGFYNFNEEKSLEKFKVGQVWALYSDKDGLPKTYGEVKKIEPNPTLNVYVALLEACTESEAMIMPICCGIFKYKSGKQKAFPLTAFSHLLMAERINKHFYKVVPQKGQIWALYKSWKGEKWDVDIVEVVENNARRTKVTMLTPVNGLKSVFGVRQKQRLDSSSEEIPQVELFRFSHQIPAFQLKEEKNSSLSGCWVLDPAISFRY